MMVDENLIILDRTTPAQIQCPQIGSTFHFGLDLPPFRPLHPSNSKNVGLAANLAILDIKLPQTRRRIDNRLVPFPAAGAPETGFASHYILHSHPPSSSARSAPLRSTPWGGKLSYPHDNCRRRDIRINLYIDAMDSNS
jgi:hypothetical protein